MRTLVASVLLLLCGVALPARGAEVRHFFGEDAMTSPAGVPFTKFQKLLKRTVDPARNRIDEEVHLRDPRGKVTTVAIELRVTENAFELRASGGEYAGRGQLFGRPWAWTGWSSELALADGATLRTIDYLTTEALFATSEYRDPRGNLVAITHSDLRGIDAAAYERLRSQLTGASPR